MPTPYIVFQETQIDLAHTNLYFDLPSPLKLTRPPTIEAPARIMDLSTLRPASYPQPKAV